MHGHSNIKFQRYRFPKKQNYFFGRAVLTILQRKLPTEEIYNLYSSPNLVMVIKPRRIRLVEHMTHAEEMKNDSNDTRIAKK